MQALETMNKLKQMNCSAKLTLDNLSGLGTDLVRLNDNWQEWDFAKLANSLRKCTDRKPQNVLNNDQKHKKESVFQIKEQK